MNIFLIYYSQNNINLSEKNLNLAYELHNGHPVILHYRAIVSRKKGNINVSLGGSFIFSFS